MGFWIKKTDLCLFSHSLSYMTVTTMLHQIYSKRELSLVSYITHILGQCRLGEDLHLPLYIFIHEVGTLLETVVNTLIFISTLCLYPIFSRFKAVKDSPPPSLSLSQQLSCFCPALWLTNKPTELWQADWEQSTLLYYSSYLEIDLNKYFNAKLAISWEGPLNTSFSFKSSFILLLSCRCWWRRQLPGTPWWASRACSSSSGAWRGSSGGRRGGSRASTAGSRWRNSSVRPPRCRPPPTSTSPQSTPPTTSTTTAWTTWPWTSPGSSSPPPWAGRTTSTPAGCRAITVRGSWSSASTPTTTASSSSGTASGRPRPTSYSVFRSSNNR